MLIPLTRDWSRLRATVLRPGAGSLLVTAIAAIAFWRTAYPTIHWWESAEYSLAAGTAGIVGPPGSLLLTLLGWPVARLSLGSSPAHVLNLLAGVLAALTTGLVYAIARRLFRLTAAARTNNNSWAALVVGAALGALTFTFSATLWEYAVQFTPYILTALFTALLLWVMLRWWEDADHPDAWRWLALLGLLFGLDFSVHRTNALMLPGALVWILLRHPQTFRTPKRLLYGTAGLLGGLAVQLLIIPISRAAMTRSPLFWNDPIDWSRFWDYTSIKRLGGGFLVQFFPRKAAFWSVQVTDALHVLGANFLHWSGSASVLGVLPSVAALLGLVILYRRDRRLAIGYGLVLFLQVTMTVLFFNIPANFFRTFDRHYLPVCVTIAVLMAYGLGMAMDTAARLALRRTGVAAGAAAILALVPVSQVMENWVLRDASHRYFTKEFATSFLTSLPPDAILFTVGDNDTFPLWYFQAVEGMRRDVTVINLAVANLPAFAEEWLQRDPSFPLAFTPAERAALAAPGATPKTVTIPVMGTSATLDLPTGTTPPAALTVTVKPQVGATLLPAEITVLDIVRTNRWRRPICFAITGTPQIPTWLAPYDRLEGLYYRVAPMVDPPANLLLLRANLLEHADYRSYTNPTIRLDKDDRTFGFLTYNALGKLFEAERKSGDLDRCRADRAALLAAIPPDRLELSASDLENLVPECRGAR